MTKKTPAALSHIPSLQRSASSGGSSTSRLGRGLSMLLGDNSGSKHHIPDIALEKIIPGPFQPRKQIEENELQKLSDSIKENGVLQPVLVRTHPEKAGFYQLIAGERRFRASQLAGLTTIPAHVRQMGEKEALAAALVENLQRSNLNPIEEAEGLERMRTSCNLSQAQIAQAVGKSRSRIANNLRLLSLPETVKVSLRDGTISQGHGVALLGCTDPEAALKQVLALNLTVRQTEELAANGSVENATPKTDKSPQNKAELKKRAEKLANSLQKGLGLEKFGLRASVQLKQEGKKGGTLKLSWKNQAELDALLKKLSEG
ncbi:ParB/RepB/Spo0J family partition protein [Acetobacteraceae bacterium]|nr:ParB/RepB/Spo0J family partition protein [Acetobacteraceae bacterium]